ncbi:NAD(P)H-dependent oxidoreductase [Candidatus Bipolaricaulota bacterium]
MNVLAINGSPRGSEGNTDILVQAFLAGVRKSGGETEVVYLNAKTIRYCTGCFACWTKTPGVCIHEDDMPALLTRMREADVVVFASPLYGNMVTGQMKTFLDRTLPLSNPAIVKMGDEYLHPPRYGDDVFRVVLISNAGFPQTHHFEGLKKTFEISTSGPRAKLAGMICCAPGPMLSVPGIEEQVQWYLDAAIQAGQEVAEHGLIDPKTQAVLDRSLTDKPGEYAAMVNGFWQQSGAPVPDSYGPPSDEDPPQGSPPLTPSESISSVRDLVSRLPQSFSPDSAGDLVAVIQFEIADEDPGAYYLIIAQGACSAFEGAHPAPRMTIHSPAEVWMDVCTGKLDGAAAFMFGKYRVSGDTSLLMRFASLFAG